MAIVFLPVTMPSDLAGQVNGKLGPCSMTHVFFPGLGTSDLHPLAARAWGTLAVKVLAETGFKLTTTGGGAYRSYDSQVRVFNQRMSSWYNPITCTLTTRTWDGKKYWLKRGNSPVATPGTSNHGWGLAIDSAIYKDSAIVNIQAVPAVWASVQENAPLCGFSWEGAKPGTKGWEPWHIRYVAGDDVPAAILEMEAFFASLPK